MSGTVTASLDASGEISLTRDWYGSGTSIALTGDIADQGFDFGGAWSFTDGLASTLTAVDVYTPSGGGSAVTTNLQIEADENTGLMTNITGLGNGGVTIYAAPSSVTPPGGLMAGDLVIETDETTHATSIITYDSLGAEHVVTFTFTRTAEPNVWAWEAEVDEQAQVISGNLDHMLSNIMKRTKEALKASSWSIFLIDDETGELVLEKTDSRRGKKDKSQDTRLKQGEGVTGWVAKEGIPLIVPDISQDQRILSEVGNGEKPAGRSLICIPIRSRERIVGVVEFTSRTAGNPFTKDDLALLTNVMYYIAFAIERSTLYHKMAELAITDDLPKLFNSRYLNRTIEVELQRSDRSQTSVALIFMDIDYFKR